MNQSDHLARLGLSITALAATAFALATLAGCGELTIGPRSERTVFWEKLGTPAKVTETSAIEVLVKDGQGVERPAKVNASGMMILDAPTYDLYRAAWEKSR